MLNKKDPDEFWLELDPDEPLDEAGDVMPLPLPKTQDSIDDIPPIDRD